MTVGVHGDHEGEMPEAGLDDFEMDPRLYQPGGVGVTQTMESEAFESGLLAILRKLLGDGILPQGSAVLAWEHEAERKMPLAE